MTVAGCRVVTGPRAAGIAVGMPAGGPDAAG